MVGDGLKEVCVEVEKKLGKISVAEKAEGLARARTPLREGLADRAFAASPGLDLSGFDFNRIGASNGREIEHRMRIHGLPWLVQLIPRKHSILLRPCRCRIHRTICHHARRPGLRVIGTTVPVSRIDGRRGAKKKTTTLLKDLPQGSLQQLEPYDDGVEDDSPRYPTVVQGHRNNMQKFKNCVVLTRVGNFYEVRRDSIRRLEPAPNVVILSCTLNKQKSWHRC